MRSIIEIALGKKSGGSRLIGLATALYRIWSKERFADIRCVMESRVARPYLPAAPGRGAMAAAFELSFDAETAHAKGQAAASTSFDLKQYYEQVSISELARGAKRFGMPRAVTALMIHLYVGPRRIRVGAAFSQAVYPRRSILAGCTFALIAVRLISIGPMEELIRVIKRRLVGWDAKISTSLYVDDGVVTTYGREDVVAILHRWVSTLVFDWVAKVLKKETAEGKSVCIVSSRKLRDALKEHMTAMNIPLTLEGEVLGVDYTVGGVCGPGPPRPSGGGR